jgi:hypothetical protein
MSYHTLARLTVRLLFDQAFVAALYANPDQALAGLDLSPSERAQLIAVDRRAWNYDPLRRRRTLRSLVEEFKISTTLILSGTRSLASLDSFFSSDLFHQSIQQRGSMGMAFARYLEDLYRSKSIDMPQLPDILRLETALARCRRELAKAGERKISQLPATISDASRVHLAPGVAVGSFQGNTISTIQRVEQYLFEVNLMPAMVLCDDAPRLDSLPEVDIKKKIYLLLSPGANGISLLNIDRNEYLTLYEAKAPVAIRQLISRAAASGVNNRRAQEILAEALEQKTLLIVE